MEIDKIESVYFTRQNLKLLLGEKRRTLDDRIASLIRKGVLARLKKGFYLNLAFINQNPDKKDLITYVGSVLVYPSYLSAKSILAQKRFLSETVFGLTYVTAKKTQKTISDNGTFIYQKIKPDLYFGFETKKVGEYEYQTATLAKALFDYLYLSTRKLSGEGMEAFLANSRFNWGVLTKSDRAEFGRIVKRAGVKKMEIIFAILKNNYAI